MNLINKAFPVIGAGGGCIVGVLGGSVLLTALGFALLGPTGGAIGLGIGAVGGGTVGIIVGAKCVQAIKKATEANESSETNSSNINYENASYNDSDVNGELRRE